MAQLKINGTSYPFRLELGGLRLYAIKKGLSKIKTKDIPAMMQDADMIEDYPVLIWAGLKSGPTPEEERFTSTPEDVKAWLEEDPSAFDRAMELINDDQTGPEPDEGKKPKAKE